MSVTSQHALTHHNIIRRRLRREVLHPDPNRPSRFTRDRHAGPRSRFVSRPKVPAQRPDLSGPLLLLPTQTRRTESAGHDPRIANSRPPVGSCTSARTEPVRPRAGA